MSLSISDAENLIENIKKEEMSLGRDPKTWYTYENHIFGAAEVTKKLAKKLNLENVEQIYISALLHDISRTEENRKQHFHGILGYEKLIKKDINAARAAITHMFPFFEIPPFEDCYKMFFNNKQDYDFVVKYLKNTQLNDIDLLIQLSDILANKDGIVTIEQRLEELMLRNKEPLDPQIVENYYKIKEYFEKKLDQSIYEIIFK